MRLWHDDLRKPPDDSWVWVSSNEEAQTALSDLTVTEISLDHDITEGNYRGDPYGSGHELVCWMIDHKLVPDKITIHSWNRKGTLRMATEFQDHDYEVTIDPIPPWKH